MFFPGKYSTGQPRVDTAIDQTELVGRTLRDDESIPEDEHGGTGFNTSGLEYGRLYVGHLTLDTTSDSIIAPFEMCGASRDFFMPANPHTGANQGL
jgi:hypothetical protein